MASYSDICTVLVSLLLFAFVPNVYSHDPPGTINVMTTGAKADGITDDTKALMDAWCQACNAPTKSKVLVPPGIYFTRNVTFQGPCKNPLEFQLDGTIKAPDDMFGTNDWVMFKYVTGFTLCGCGAFDGNGARTWAENQCDQKDQGGKCQFPVNVRFNFVNDAVVTGITSLDSKNFHINLMGCKNIKFQGVKIRAPATSINTDGIHMSDSECVEISGSTIATGDDCISLGSGIVNLNVFDVTCGPGHGISIGSLGKCDTPPETVNGVHVRNVTFCETDNGVRIKTWPSGTDGTVTNITFEDIIMNNAKNPIVIDQEYCPYNKCDRSSPSKIKIDKVLFKNIRGTSATKEAITLVCGLPCDNVELCTIDLKYNGPDGPAVSRCANVKPISALNTIPCTCPLPVI